MPKPTFATLFPKIVEISKSFGERRSEFMENVRQCSIYSYVLERKSQLQQDSTNEKHRLLQILKTWDTPDGLLQQFSDMSREKFLRTQRARRWPDDISLLRMIDTVESSSRDIDQSICRPSSHLCLEIGQKVRFLGRDETFPEIPEAEIRYFALENFKYRIVIGIDPQKIVVPQLISGHLAVLFQELDIL